MTRRIGGFLLMFVLAGCTATSTMSQQSVPPLTRTRIRRPLELGGSLHWLSSSGLGYAMAECGSGWTAIAGGAYSAKATDIGTGSPGSDGSSWVAISPGTYDTLTAYVLCAPSYGLSGYFQRVAGFPTKKHPKGALAPCSNGDMLVAGWSYNATYAGASIVGGKPAGWAAGGSTAVEAVAECATPAEIALGLSFVSRSGNNVYATCDGTSEAGDGDDVIGGYFGIATVSSGTPVVERQFPSIASGAGSTLPIGFRFLDKSSSSGWVVCQED
jgi:hypothetical protein